MNETARKPSGDSCDCKTPEAHERAAGPGGIGCHRPAIEWCWTCLGHPAVCPNHSGGVAGLRCTYREPRELSGPASARWHRAAGHDVRPVEAAS